MEYRAIMLGFVSAFLTVQLSFGQRRGHGGGFNPEEPRLRSSEDGNSRDGNRFDFNPRPDQQIIQFTPRDSSPAAGCGGALTGSGSFWYPPNYPASYPDYAECRWTISAAPGSLIQVQFNEPFGIPGRDFLVVVDGIYADQLGPACSLSDYFALGTQGQAFILIRGDRADYSSFTSTSNTVIAVFCAQGQRGSFVPRVGFRGQYFSIPQGGNGPFNPPAIPYTPFVPPPTPAPATNPPFVWTPPAIVWTPPPVVWIAPPAPATFPPVVVTLPPPTPFRPPVTQPPFQWTTRPPITPSTQSSSATCGMPILPPVSGRIIGGNPARLGSWPWMVALVDARYNGQFCGGVLVDEFWVLTAAHCVVDKPAQNLLLRIGAINFNATVGDPGRGVDYRAAFTIIQPTYDGNSFTNDLALVRLTTKVAFSQFVKPICLPSGAPQDGVVCYIAGYGLTTPMQRKKRQVDILPSGSSVLMETDIPIVNQATCQNFFSQAFPGLIKISNSQVCAGSVYPVAKDSCNGDSGGPLVCRRSGHYEVVGLTSFGVGCGRSDVFGAYTNVWSLVQWINSIRGLTISGK